MHYKCKREKKTSYFQYKLEMKKKGIDKYSYYDYCRFFKGYPHIKTNIKGYNDLSDELRKLSPYLSDDERFYVSNFIEAGVNLARAFRYTARRKARNAKNNYRVAFGAIICYYRETIHLINEKRDFNRGVPANHYFEDEVNSIDDNNDEFYL